MQRRGGDRRRGLGRCLLLAAAMLAGPAGADTPPKATFAQATHGLRPLPGLLPVYLDAPGGRILLRLTPDAQGDCGSFLYQVYMRSGLGSTPVGIDRANPGPTGILQFRRAGPRIVAELQNQGFRAAAGTPDEQQAVRESFPPSIIWSGDILAEDADGGLLVDMSGFLSRDAFDVAGALREAKQGDFKLAAGQSYVDVGETGVFPDNLEFEAHETFVSDAPGSEVRGIAPDPHAVTLIEHQSLIRLPGPGFIPRRADARTGSFSRLVADYAAPLGSPVVYRLAERFRLEKTDPAAARSTVKKPIIFYVDRAAPEPIRSALLEGARWWAQAFDAAGFIDAFRVELLPPGASPLDARYNVVNWVHRQTRGWSYGYAVTDPRTGEIVKGAVLLGSLRVRQDRMIFEGLVGADKTGSGGSDDPIVASLARLRQLAVHETGHALGLAHNFAGSSFDDRSSVMDYPAPRITTKDGRLDFSDAYKIGLGSWDRFAIRWLYSEVPQGAAGDAALEAMVRDGYAHGLRYVRDEDARPVGSAHPAGAIWDDGPDPVASLQQVLEVRKLALAHFGPAAIPPGASLSELRRVIVPIYLFHRYQVEAAAKSVGGVDFTYAARGDGLAGARPVAAAAQRRALAAVLTTLDPAVLDLPDSVIDLLSQGRDGAPDPQYETEIFGDGHTPVFDISTAAEAAAEVTLRALLDPARLARIADQGARDRGQLGLAELLDQTIARALSPTLPGRAARLQQVVRSRLAARLAAAARDGGVLPVVTAELRGGLERFGRGLSQIKDADPASRVQAAYLAGVILSEDHDDLAALAETETHRHVTPPPGMPIGGGEDGWFSEVAAP